MELWCICWNLWPIMETTLKRLLVLDNRVDLPLLAHRSALRIQISVLDVREELFSDGSIILPRTTVDYPEIQKFEELLHLWTCMPGSAVKLQHCILSKVDILLLQDLD